MIDEALGQIEYNESGSGPTVVLVPGSCSTGAAWRPFIAAWNEQFRSVTTSLLGYGGTVERRTAVGCDISLNAEVVESVIRRSGGRVHLIGHSFGGLVALAVALRGRVSLASIVIIEAPAVDILREQNELQHYRTFRQMSESYFADFASGNPEAIAAMIDFYGGAGTFASWPLKLRAYAAQTTPVNILDWGNAFEFPLSAASLGSLEIPLHVISGAASPTAVRRANALLAEFNKKATFTTINGASHFMIATHVSEVADLISHYVHCAEVGSQD